MTRKFVDKVSMARCRRSGAGRKAFTLIELLVSIGVIGLLVSLLLPAVHASREAARSVQCKNHLKQIALATMNYEARNGCFPKNGPHFSVFTYLLDDLGDSALANQYRQNLTTVNAITANSGYYISAPRPGYLTCPSMGHNFQNSQPDSVPCYHGNLGWMPRLVSGKYPWNGVITRVQSPTDPSAHLTFVHVRASNITDGLSHTACFSEKLLNDANHFKAPISDPDLIVKAESCQASTRPGGRLPNQSWDSLPSSYSHLLPPNHHICTHVDTAGSRHPGGCHVALCDGAVRMVSSHIDRSVWRAVGTRSDSDAIGDF